MNLRKVFAISLIVIFLGGCVGAGIIDVSEPSLVSGRTNARIDKSIILMDGISISVRPDNEDIGFQTMGIIVPVIPLPGKARDNTEMPFEIEIQFDAVSSEYSFDPLKVLLITQAKEMKPLHAFGPMRGGVPLEGRKTLTPGHKWGCGYNRREAVVFVAPQHVQLNEKSCFVLRFPTNTIPTTETFTVSIEGLYQHEKLIPPISLQFKEGSRGAFGVVNGN